ncbi:Senescence-specific cysteine protease SAG39 [Capsicum annuum]|uniref:Senescence-specific cysteine protease SAG39 n=1 Tax=Capsicum annuum TaxID=4072 RepID=A0A1U8FVI9_CAPAN|nr:Senescence-specific cysteine protease SAG39 [Capsicum annuum]KAF3657200.1 Senescence-specific cysteine protease SAG39 [Capsicum annuum]PHT90393.1 Senescence-specific cysteine protease SAG39 [Capsicum annuum]
MAFANLCLALFFISLGLWSSQVASSRPIHYDATSMRARHEQWIAHHEKVYNNLNEKEMRSKIFKENVERIETFNAGEDKGYKLGVNKFADLTNEEFRVLHLGYKRSSHPKVMSSSKPNTHFRYANVTDIPPTMDWRKKGAVTPIKDQKDCGCCWAFSAVAAMESLHQLKTGKLNPLSEQELVDCDVEGEDVGCSGGLLDTAFKFIMKNKGLTTEANYPYEGADGVCNKKKSAVSAAKITGYEDVPANNEKALLQAVANQPVSVAIDGSSFDFQFYSSGVFSGSCSTWLNHAVTAVGYGATSDGTKYWIIKNSWGSKWGENGYIHMKRDIDDREGLCGLAMEASYPTA